MAEACFILLLALVLDRLIGDPPWLWRHITHPVILFGKAIAWVERRANHPDSGKTRRRFNGCLAIVVLSTAAWGVAILLEKICQSLGFVGIFIEVALVALFLAQKSLADHVMAVHDALQKGGLGEGRAAVSLIVGRNPQTLEIDGVCRAAIESLAENSSDGVIAPAFWFLLFGLPGIFCYKMLNTADSMIGHKNARYAAFGFAAAKLDDIANYIPARLTGFLTVLAAGFMLGFSAAEKAWCVMLQDARHHRSPNAGWPESAFAGALDIRLAGPRDYGTERVEEPFQNADGRNPSVADIVAAVALFWSVMTVFALSVVLCSLLVWYG